MKTTIAVSLAFFTALSSFLSAQQNPDAETWRKEYEGRIKHVVESRTKQKPNFEADARFSKPDYVVFVPKVEPDKLGDTYNDHFLVFDKPNGKLFALCCQASVEGALDQHVAFFRSTDKGKTWEKPRVLAGNRTVAEGLSNGGAIASWAFPLVSKSGRIYVLYNQFIPGKVSTNRQHTGLMAGIYSDDDGETWSKPETIPMPRTSNDSADPSIPPEWVVWQKPLRLVLATHLRKMLRRIERSNIMKKISLILALVLLAVFALAACGGAASSAAPASTPAAPASTPEPASTAPEPETGATQENLLMAQHTIDVLTMLRDKTKTGLDEEESRLLEGLLYELRMKYVLKTK